MRFALSSSRRAHEAGRGGLEVTFSWSALPQPRPARASVHVDRATESALRRGEPWVFGSAVTKLKANDAVCGDVAVVYDHSNRFLAAGLYDPDSPIVVRALVHNKPAPISPASTAERAEAACRRRKPLLGADTDGYRLIHGPGDGFEGLVADRYGSTVVIKLYTHAWWPWLSAVFEGIERALGDVCVVLRFSRNLNAPGATHGLEDGAVVGDEGLLATEFLENGLRFAVDPRRGQKTGFFLDQRENREQVEPLCRNASMLNVFSYTGGFSLYAARGGALSVVSVDVSRRATETVAHNFTLNASNPSVAKCDHQERCGDAFDVMAAAARAGERYRVVVVDPPAMAKRGSEVERSLRSYQRLARLAARLVERNGVLVFASCSSRVGADQLWDAVKAGTRAAGRSAQIVRTTGHAPDHPVPTETLQYLKCIFARLP